MGKIIYAGNIKLYLGDLFDANNETELKQKQITSVVNVAEG